jgi:hypothetical protein
MATHSPDHRPPPENPTTPQAPPDSGTWDRVDQAAWESFPASDPPGHAPREHVPEIKETEEVKQAKRAGRKLLRRLGRELFQAETSGRLHCRREAERLGDVPPARPLLAASQHAEEALKSMAENTKRSELPMSVAGALLGAAFSTAREFVLDRLLSSELSYRGTLLGMKHGVDVVRMINQLAQREGDVVLVEWTDAWLRRREPLVQEAEAQLAWFANNVETAARVARPMFVRPAARRRS